MGLRSGLVVADGTTCVVSCWPVLFYCHAMSVHPETATPVRVFCLRSGLWLTFVQRIVASCPDSPDEYLIAHNVPGTERFRSSVYEAR